MKIIINIKDDTPFNSALECVQQVIKQGRISDDGRSYCYLTVFTNTIHVAAVANKKSDTFTVWMSDQP